MQMARYHYMIVALYLLVLRLIINSEIFEAHRKVHKMIQLPITLQPVYLVLNILTFLIIHFFLRKNVTGRTKDRS